MLQLANGRAAERLRQRAIASIYDWWCEGDLANICTSKPYGVTRGAPFTSNVSLSELRESRVWAPTPDFCTFLLFSNKRRDTLILVSSRSRMNEKTDVWQGTLALMVLKTLETLGPLHGYGIARRIEQTSGDSLSVRYGTLYPALMKLEQEGYISAAWGVSDNNRRAKYYALTRAGRKRLASEARDWDRTTAIIARFFAPSGDAS
jgi:transcriptional regulator